MDIVKLDFEQAKAKHLLFKSKLRSILYGAEIDEAPVLSHYECAVGKWIYSHALQVYGHLPEMQELEKVHAEIHSSARKLVDEYKEGKVEKARQGLTDMEKVADHLVQLLGVVEAKIAANAPSDNKKNYQGPEEIRSELQNLLKANLKLDQIIKEQSGEILRERETLHNFFMQTPAIMAITKSPDHVYELANARYIETVGNRKIIGKTLRDALPELEGQGFYELMDEVYKTGKPFVGKETPVKLNRNGVMEELFIDFSYVAIKNSEGQTDGILVFAYDVTQQVIARHQLEEAGERAHFITEAMPQKVWTAAPDGNVYYFNKRWLDYTGLSLGEIKNWGWKDIIHPDDLEENVRLWQNSIDTGTDFQFEHRFKRHDGKYRWHLSRGIPQKDKNGNVLMWVGTNTDIHEMKTIQDQLKQSYEDLEVKVKFRNVELEREIVELRRQVEVLKKSS